MFTCGCSELLRLILEVFQDSCISLRREKWIVCFGRVDVRWLFCSRCAHSVPNSALCMHTSPHCLHTLAQLFNTPALVTNEGPHTSSDSHSWPMGASALASLHSDCFISSSPSPWCIQFLIYWYLICTQANSVGFPGQVLFALKSL